MILFALLSLFSISVSFLTDSETNNSVRCQYDEMKLSIELCPAISTAKKSYKNAKSLPEAYLD